MTEPAEISMRPSHDHGTMETCPPSCPARQEWDAAAQGEEA